MARRKCTSFNLHKSFQVANQFSSFTKYSSNIKDNDKRLTVQIPPTAYTVFRGKHYLRAFKSFDQNEFSLSLWVELMDSSLYGDQVIISNRYFGCKKRSEAFGYMIYLSKENEDYFDLKVVFHSPSNGCETISAKISTQEADQWIHITLVCKPDINEESDKLDGVNNIFFVYINGQLGVSAFINRYISISSAFSFGVSNDNLSPLYGSLAKFQYWDHALTEGDAFILSRGASLSSFLDKQASVLLSLDPDNLDQDNEQMKTLPLQIISLKNTRHKSNKLSSRDLSSGHKKRRNAKHKHSSSSSSSLSKEKDIIKDTDLYNNTHISKYGSMTPVGSVLHGTSTESDTIDRLKQKVAQVRGTAQEGDFQSLNSLVKLLREMEEKEDSGISKKTLMEIMKSSLKSVKQYSKHSESEGNQTGEERGHLEIDEKTEESIELTRRKKLESRQQYEKEENLKHRKRSDAITSISDEITKETVNIEKNNKDIDSSSSVKSVSSTDTYKTKKSSRNKGTKRQQENDFINLNLDDDDDLKPSDVSSSSLKSVSSENTSVSKSSDPSNTNTDSVMNSRTTKDDDDDEEEENEKISTKTTSSISSTGSSLSSVNTDIKTNNNIPSSSSSSDVTTSKQGQQDTTQRQSSVADTLSKSEKVLTAAERVRQINQEKMVRATKNTRGKQSTVILDDSDEEQVDPQLVEENKKKKMYHDYIKELRLVSDINYAEGITEFSLPASLEEAQSLILTERVNAKYAWGKDELCPVTGGSNDNWGDISMTLLDSLDTLYLMNRTEDIQLAEDYIKAFLDFDQNAYVSVFETTIRVLGGLLSIYEYTNNTLYLEKAKDMGGRLLYAFDTPSGLPHGNINLHSHVPKRKTKNERVGLAEFGTLSLEFRTLSYYTHNDSFAKAINKLTYHLLSLDTQEGLFPIYFDLQRGKPHGRMISIGGMGDTYYEYLLKAWIHGGKKEPKLLKAYQDAVSGIENLLLRRNQPEHYLYAGKISGKNYAHEMNHLTCFYSGLLVLGVMHGASLNVEKDIKNAKSLAYTCYQMYMKTPTHLSPENMKFPGGKKMTVDNNGAMYLLRPETIESFYYLYTYTKDPIYIEWGWDIFKAINKICQTNHGYGSYGDVRDVERSPDDRTETFFYSETIKYFYLLFNPKPLLDLNKSVLTTEAHPLRIIQDLDFSTITGNIFPAKTNENLSDPVNNKQSNPAHLRPDLS
ncbi:hypothetical protein WA158_002661 [Blastocystis sp. Blastoise]